MNAFYLFVRMLKLWNLLVELPVILKNLLRRMKITIVDLIL